MQANHRWCTPSDRVPAVQLIDFGMSITCPPETTVFGCVGRPAYMAPEVAFNNYNIRIAVNTPGLTLGGFPSLRVRAGDV